MSKENEQLNESENEACAANSENVVENVKYIKKLELQRSVLLNMLVGSDINQPADTNSIDPDNPDQ
jgi:hypothetical protein